jgi:hypothetical protein
LLAYRVGDLGTAVADIHAPQTGQAIEELATVYIGHPAAAPRINDVRSLSVELVVIRERVDVVRPIQQL